ncbi:hypothetical protein PACTADRAFT_47131 [Pachysolen tannophilus NRRL Y-2460]|uniref:Glycoside hydrolase family 127 protein n=1 Tax=Pachysolen tannophilus NRRL Y-2460 TaxID=669874 RepID=A0A1E4TMZ2_PACTA|nr:hypothetical protein PACTADRAFT_47131 [Pachysolen tannophilus NRRL Y-2460]
MEANSVTTKYIDDVFWNSRISVIRTATLPSMFDLLKKTGRWDSLKLIYKEGNGIPKPHHFWDSDIAKFVESLCLGLKYLDKNSKLYEQYLKWINEAIHMLRKAQHNDGYINTYYTVVEPGKRFTNICWMHELYCCGHLLEAAIAHCKATKSEKFLKIMCRYIDLLCIVFGPGEGQIHGYPGHEEIELALVKLYEFRPVERYLTLLNYFIEQRGYEGGKFFDDEAFERGINPYSLIFCDNTEATEHLRTAANEEIYNTAYPEPRSYWYHQAEAPIRELKEIKGHCVRATYYLAGAQGLARIKNDISLENAVWTLWRDMVEKKMYIHGGIGSIGKWEGFGTPFELRWDGYSETCASCGVLFLGRQILMSSLKGEVAQVMERALYNNVLGAVSLDGTAFYYNQPITGSARLKRQKWFSCSCCPPNVSRLFNNLEDYLFTLKDHLIAINFFIGGVYETKLKEPYGDIKLKVISEYPMQGKVIIDITTSKPLILAIRKPDSEKLFISDTHYKIADGYIFFAPKVWNNKIILEFDINVEIINPNPNVSANENKLAIKRGPFIYAIQESDYDGDGTLDEVAISSDTTFTLHSEDKNGVNYYSLLTKMNGLTCKFIPYFITNNNNPGEDFRVWIKHERTKIKALLA